MRPFNWFNWVCILLAAVTSTTAQDELTFDEVAFYNRLEDRLWMERNGTLRGPKIFVPNPSFELNEGRPWKLHGTGVEVVDDPALSRKGRHSLLFTIEDTLQRPQVYTIPLHGIQKYQIYYVTFHYRIIELDEVSQLDKCYITLALGNMIAGYHLYVKTNEDPRFLRRDQRRYVKVTIPMYTLVGLERLNILAFCNNGIGQGDAVRVSIDDIRIEEGEGQYWEWAFDQPREKYEYAWRKDDRPVQTEEP
ncbi:hypothetical protein FLONG3_812 [Fusarium longipes]|uniref:Uncharacterized protein n=1 Tax=Fusarium longipes TaxID=694270 RepID=A0A395T8J3_9HYPO|nr:hypothetical protein FLONG3_812 [Fusarium longipes]